MPTKRNSARGARRRAARGPSHRVAARPAAAAVDARRQVRRARPRARRSWTPRPRSSRATSSRSSGASGSSSRRRGTRELGAARACARSWSPTTASRPTDACRRTTPRAAAGRARGRRRRTRELAADDGRVVHLSLKAAARLLRVAGSAPAAVAFCRNSSHASGGTGRAPAAPPASAAPRGAHCRCGAARSTATKTQLWRARRPRAQRAERARHRSAEAHVIPARDLREASAGES